VPLCRANGSRRRRRSRCRCGLAALGEPHGAAAAFRKPGHDVGDGPCCWLLAVFLGDAGRDSQVDHPHGGLNAGRQRRSCDVAIIDCLALAAVIRTFGMRWASALCGSGVRVGMRARVRSPDAAVGASPSPARTSGTGTGHRGRRRLCLCNCALNASEVNGGAAGLAGGWWRLVLMW
jgi:hypothetical protein